MLTIKEINLFYDRTHVLKDVSLSVQQGEAVCLLGRHGSGKTSILKTVPGITPPLRGSITFDGEEIAGKPPYEICRLGIGYTPQNKEVFPNLTVEQNLRVVKGKRGGDGWHIKRIYSLFPDLRWISQRYGMHLSGGEQQMLAIARGVMINPKLILLDEPSIGLAPRLLVKVGILLREIVRTGTSILVAEQNIRFAFSLATRGYFIDRGRVQLPGDRRMFMDTGVLQKLREVLIEKA